MHLHIDQRLPKRIEADSERLERILFILLQNSLKYTLRGCIKVSVELGRQSLQSPNEVTLVFKISDTGCGIAPEAQTDMFQLFSNLKTENHQSTSVGLGLAYCQAVVSKLGGTIQC